MPTLSNELVNNQWLDEIIMRVYWKTSENGGHDPIKEPRLMTFIENPDPKQAKAAILSKLESIEQEARIDELDNLPWKRADRYGINSPYVTKQWLTERKATLKASNRSATNEV